MRSALAALTLVLCPGLCEAGASGRLADDSPAHIRQHADEYAWRLFIALDRAADPEPRGPERGRVLGAPGPVLWETWMSARQVYREDGADPGPWKVAHASSEPRFETFSLKDFPRVRHVVTGRMVDGFDPRAGSRRLTEIRLDRTAYEFIRSRELYDLEGQRRAAISAQGVSFPSGATEVKAKWRPIAESERARYHSLRVLQSDGSTQLYGLTALAIATKVLPNWFWATFEHVDNPSLAGSEGWQLPSRDRFACAGERADCNRIPGGIGLEGSVWENYRLRGTQTDFVDAAGEPQRLANSELEAGFQTTGSCMTCHARASIAAQAAGSALRLPIFDIGKAAAQADPLARRGFVGLPRSEWFDPAAADATRYVPLDFVWSLSQARARAAGGVSP
jgi:hypothetical protein